MARRFATKNATMGMDTLFSVAHGLGRTPNEWALNLRWLTGFVAAASSYPLVKAYIAGISTSNIRVRVARASVVAGLASPTGDLFAWVNHSIVK